MAKAPQDSSQLVDIPLGGYETPYLTGLQAESGGVLTGGYQNKILSTMANWIRVDPKAPYPIAVRPPVEVIQDFATRGSMTTAIPRGCHFSAGIQRYLEVWDQTLYNAAVNTDPATPWAWTSNTSIDDTPANGGPAGFADGQLLNGTKYCFVATTQSAFTVIADGTITELTDSVLTGTIESHIPTPVFLDGYIFLAKQNSRNLYNSDPGDPTTWHASTYTATEAGAGEIVALAKHNNHVVAFCTDHTEFFRDAGIAAPNSPLLRVQEHMQQIGCVNRATVATYGDTTVFVGRDITGIVGVYMLENFKIRKISNVGIDAAMRIYGGSGDHSTGVITDWTLGDTTNSSIKGHTTGYIIPIHGRPFYVLTTHFGQTSRSSGGSTVASGQTFVYDVEADEWIEFRSTQHPTGAGGSAMYSCFPFPFASVCNITVHSAAGELTTGKVVFQPNQGTFYLYPPFLNEGSTTPQELDVGNSKASYQYNTPRQLIVTKYTDFGIPTLKFMGEVYPEFLGTFSYSAGSLICLDNNSTTWANQSSPPTIALPAVSGSGNTIGRRLYVGGSFNTRQMVITTYGYGSGGPSMLLSLKARLRAASGLA